VAGPFTVGQDPWTVRSTIYELVPRIAAVIEDIVVAFEHPVRVGWAGYRFATSVILASLISGSYLSPAIRKPSM
jgi:hypothetical protein